MAFPLHPEIPVEGMALSELFKGMDYDLDAAHERLMRIADEEGLPYGDAHKMTYQSKPAQMLGLWAETKGAGDAFHMAAFKAVFVDDLNIADREVLIGLAEAAQLDRAEAADVLDKESLMDKVDADWALSKKLGVTAVPTFIYGGRAIVGAQPYDALKQLVQNSGSGPSPFNILRS